LLDDHILLLLKIRHFLRNKLIQHLLLKTERSDGEVQNRNLDSCLRRVVRIRDSSGHEELERVVPGDALITKFE